MNKIFIFILSVVLLTSCSYQKRLNKWCAKCPVEKHDSIVTIHTESIKDSIIYINPDSSWLEASVACDSTGKVFIGEIIRLRSENGKLQVQLYKNHLYVSTITQKKEIPVQSKTTNNINSSKITETKIVKINELTKWQTFRLWLGNIMLILILVLIGYMIFKLIKKFN